MIRKIQFFALAALAFFLAFPLAAQNLAVTGATLVNPGEEPQPNTTILIRDGRVAETGPASEINVPDGFETLEARGKWAIPGLIDAHVHFFQSGGLHTRPDILNLREYAPYLRHYRPYEAERQWILNEMPAFFRRYLACGVTGAADVGGPLTNFDVRARAEASQMAPEVAVTGPLISTYQPEAFQIDDAPIIKVKNAKEARELVRKQLPYKPDFIKIWYIVTPGQPAKKNLPIVKAVVDESHKNNLRVCVHATQLETARLAVEAGCDILVHSIDDAPVDDAFLKLLKDNDILYIPTLMVHARYNETFRQRWSFTQTELLYSHPFVLSSLFDFHAVPDSALSPKLLAYRQKTDTVRPERFAMENIQRVLDAGIPIATGTDAGNIGTQHAASYFVELKMMAEAGMTPAQILTASTRNAARVMGRDDLGEIKPGALADLVLLEENPLEDVGNFEKISHVVKSGRPYRRDTLLALSPEDLVEVQLNAYNARHIDAFMETFADTCKLYNYPDELQTDGAEAMRPRYESFFDRVPDLHCNITERIAQGKYVADHERVTGLPEGRILRAGAIYKVEGGKIVEVRFLR